MEECILTAIQLAEYSRNELYRDYTHLSSGLRYRRFPVARSRADSLRNRSKTMHERKIATRVKDKKHALYTRSNAYNCNELLLVRTGQGDLAPSHKNHKSIPPQIPPLRSHRKLLQLSPSGSICTSPLVQTGSIQACFASSPLLYRRRWRNSSTISWGPASS